MSLGLSQPCLHVWTAWVRDLFQIEIITALCSKPFSSASNYWRRQNLATWSFSSAQANEALVVPGLGSGMHQIRVIYVEEACDAPNNMVFMGIDGVVCQRDVP